MTIHIGMEAWKELHRYPCDLHLQAKLDTIFLQTWTHTWVFATSTTKPLWNLISPPPPDLSFDRLSTLPRQHDKPPPPSTTTGRQQYLFLCRNQRTARGVGP
jgi:hypothetical protein